MAPTLPPFGSLHFAQVLQDFWRQSMPLHIDAELSQTSTGKATTISQSLPRPSVACSVQVCIVKDLLMFLLWATLHLLIGLHGFLLGKPTGKDFITKSTQAPLGTQESRGRKLPQQCTKVVFLPKMTSCGLVPHFAIKESETQTTYTHAHTCGE